MTQPPAPTVVIADIARETTQTDIQSSLVAIQEILTTLSGKVDALMSEDATVAGEVAAEETDLTSLTSSYQALATALESEDGLSPTTLAALATFKSQLDTLTGTVAADVPVTPPVPPVTGA